MHRLYRRLRIIDAIAQIEAGRAPGELLEDAVYRGYREPPADWPGRLDVLAAIRQRQATPPARIARSRATLPRDARSPAGWGWRAVASTPARRFLPAP